MDDNILQFPSKKDPDPNSGKWVTGPAKCLCCQGKWMAIIPIPIPSFMECPFCGCEKGVMEYPVYRFGVPHWTCECGNDLFHVTPDSIYCPNCGKINARVEV